jgi:energy-coupling factor transport system substrate-specific component
MNYRWRTIDIVIAAVIAVAFGVIFWAWNIVWSATEGAFAFFPPAQTLLYGVWLMPAVLGGLIIRKPGAALFTEAVAATISALLGAAWGATVIPQGLVQGLGAELAFAILLYRSCWPGCSPGSAPRCSTSSPGTPPTTCGATGSRTRC